MGSSPGQGTKNPHARELLSSLVTTTEPMYFGAYAKQQEKSQQTHKQKQKKIKQELKTLL